MKCRRCREYHEPVSIECTPPLNVYEPTVSEALEDVRGNQRADALSRLDGTAHTMERPWESITTPPEQLARDPSTAHTAQWKLPAPAAAAPVDTWTWYRESRSVAAVTPLRVDRDGAFNAGHKNSPSDRRARTEAARRGPMPMPDLANADGSIRVPEQPERNRLDDDFEHYDPDRWHSGPHTPLPGMSAAAAPRQPPVLDYQQTIDAQWRHTLAQDLPTRPTGTDDHEILHNYERDEMGFWRRKASATATCPASVSHTGHRTCGSP